MQAQCQVTGFTRLNKAVQAGDRLVVTNACLQHRYTSDTHLQMAPKSIAQSLFDKADKKANSSGGWFSSSSSKYEEAGDLYQQAANSFKIEKLFKEAGDAHAREAECRENCKEQTEAANAWWNAAKAYKRGYPDRTVFPFRSLKIV